MTMNEMNMIIYIFDNEIEKNLPKGNTHADGDENFDGTRDDDSDVPISFSQTDEDDMLASRKPRYIC